MCKDNTITTSWSEIGAIIGFLIIGCGIIVTMVGVRLTWGEVIIIPFILTFFLNKKRVYCFSGSGFTMQWMFHKHTVLAEEIKQVLVHTTKSGTWIVIKLNGAPSVPSKVSRVTLLSYSVRNRKESFLLPLQWGERDKALEILRVCCPQKIKILS